MPTYCTKEVKKINAHALEYIIIAQKSSNDDFDPVIKKLYIEKICDNIYLKGYNFDFTEFKRTKLLFANCPIIINNEVQEATIKIDELPKDIDQWNGDIAFLFLVILRINKINDDILIKVNQDIKQNEVRRKDYVSKRAYERFSLL